MVQFGTLLSTQDFPSGGGQTIILNGTVPPGESTGNVNEFFMDTVGKALYGPKTAPVSGTAISQTLVPAETANLAAPYNLGLKVRFSSPGLVTALGFYRPATSTVTSRTLTLYRNGVSVGTATSSGETGSGWKQITLSTPIAVDPGVDYVTAYNNGSSFHGQTNLIPPPASPFIKIINACYTTGFGFPTTTVTNYHYFADLVFSTSWPLAIKSA